MKKTGKKITALLLALAMVATTFLGYAPADEAQAAEGSRKWITITCGSNNNGGHAYGDPSKKAPIFLLDGDKTVTEGKTLSLTLKPSINWGVFYTYTDDSNWLYVGWDDNSGWYYQYQIGGNGAYAKFSGGDAPAVGEEMTLSISVSRETLTVSYNGDTQSVNNQALTSLKFDGHFGVKTTSNSISFADVTYDGQDCMSDNWRFCADRDGQQRTETEEKLVSLSGTVTGADNKPLEKATVRAGINSAQTDAQGRYTISGLAVGKEYTVSVSKPGYDPFTTTYTPKDNVANTLDAKLSLKAPLDLNAYDTIASAGMKVYIGKNFPMVARYQMLKDGAEQKDVYFRGNEGTVDTVTINGVAVKPTVTVKETKADSRTYSLTVKDEDSQLDLVMDVKISVEVTKNEEEKDEDGKNVLTWEVTKIEKASGCAKIATIDIPQLSIISIDATEEGANFAGAQLTTATKTSGDFHINFEEGFKPMESDGYLYGFLQNGKLSAGVSSNSEAEKEKRVVRTNGADMIGLTSAPWYYELGDNKGQKSITAQKYQDYSYPLSELPKMQVVVTADENGDGDIDWNDGALAFRAIRREAYGSDAMKDIVNYRIVMNFASMAPNPFLVTADNIRKVYLATDGLPQAVMLKGYGNEGHDSANSEYADIAEREGGAEDFQKLIKIAHEYNTEVGIHVNAHEIYPEAASMNDQMITSPTDKGWGWIDQSIVIDKIWDLASQARWKRFVQLYDRINNTHHYSKTWPDAVGESTGTVDKSKEEIQKEADSLKDNMDFIYLDVWYQDAWETRQIVKEINSLGWRFSTEFPYESEYDATWYHWGTDTNYGGDSTKGHNSEIMRFIYNDQRDTHVLNHPPFGGTADNPLLGGFKLYGFEGWQGNQDYNNYIKQTFNENLPTKFLQHYYVTDWEDYAEGEAAPTQNKEKKITLKNDAGDIVVVERKEEKRSDNNIERTITLNGKKVLDDVTYLLPWTDNQDGSEKLYHWNLDADQEGKDVTTWELPDSWKNQKSVIMYQLTDQGRVNKKSIQVVNGTVTLKAEAAVPYVIVKGIEAKLLKDDFGGSDHVTDPGFNGYAAGDHLDAADWSGDIEDKAVVVEKASTGDQRLTFKDPGTDVAVSTKITGLTKGKDYVAEVYVQNDSDVKAAIEVDTGSKKVSNYTLRSILGNYVQCDNKHGTKMQRMQVSFVAESTEAALTLSREAGKGSSYMDDIRIVEKKLDNFQADGSFKQDFETVVQGLYPFVLSYGQGVSDPVTHLSQKHEPYTQVGWGARVIDDVIDGNWSLKHHGANNGIIYQTIPQNFRFEPGKVYTVEFDYESGPDKAYAMVVGDGELYYQPTEDQYLAQARGIENKGHVSMKVVGSGSGQTWIGLFEKSSRMSEDEQKNSWGERDFVLDNLKIREDTTAVSAAISATDLCIGETAQISGSNLDRFTWENSNEAVAVLDKATWQVKALTAGTATLTATPSSGDPVTFTITVSDSYEVEVSGLTAEANTEQGAGDPTPASNAVDGNSGTQWHSAYSPKMFTVGAANKAVLTVTLENAASIKGFRFQQRAQGPNGIVQKFDYQIKDESGKVLASQNDVAVPAASQINGAWYTVNAEADNVKTVVISVSQGQNNFAAIAEVQIIGAQKVATTFDLKESAITVNLGETKQLELKLPEGTEARGLIWTSDKEDVAKVSQEGYVTGLKKGSATITVSNAAGVSKTCKVTVATADQKIKEAVKEAEKVDVSGLAADNLLRKELEDAIKAANAVSSDPTKTQAEIDAAAAELKKAYERLTVPLPYTDVKKADWFYKYTFDAKALDLMKGKDEKTFAPTEYLVRAQFAQVLWNMEQNVDAEFIVDFDDVKENSGWFVKPIQWAAAEGIVTGYSNNNNFGVNDKIIREQMATMMFRYAQAKGYDVSASVDLDTFPDGDKVDAYAVQAMKWCVAEGIITGDQGKLNPHGYTNRAVCATIITRFVERYGK